MFSPSALQELNDQFTRNAQARKRKPKVFFNVAEIQALPGGPNHNDTAQNIPIPMMGDYVPEGWERDPYVEDLFIDTSGLGAPNEPALTLSQLNARLVELVEENPRRGFGLCDPGQFQAYVRVYVPKGSCTGKKPAGVSDDEIRAYANEHAEELMDQALGDNTGYCVLCGADAMAEPDARGHRCEGCERNSIYGVSELIFYIAF